MSLVSGTFKQIADHVDRKMVARQAQRMSRVPRPSGEDVHPCNALLVLFVDIFAIDCEVQSTGEQRINNADQVYTVHCRWRRTKDLLHVLQRRNGDDGKVVLPTTLKVRRGAQGSRLESEM